MPLTKKSIVMRKCQNIRLTMKHPINYVLLRRENLEPLPSPPQSFVNMKYYFYSHFIGTILFKSFIIKIYFDVTFIIICTQSVCTNSAQTPVWGKINREQRTTTDLVILSDLWFIAGSVSSSSFSKGFLMSASGFFPSHFTSWHVQKKAQIVAKSTK